MSHPCIVPWNEGAARQHAKGYALPFVSESCGARQLKMHVSVINSGEAAHPPHQHEGEEIMFLLEGAAEATIGDETHVIGPMTALFCPENVMHGLRNVGDVPIKYMVIRAT